MQPTRILEEARGFGFTTITAMTEHDIPEVIERHSKFIEDHPLGYGMWIWKPSIILQRLAAIPEGDVLIYGDAGMHLNQNGRPRYYDYLARLKQWDMVVFSTPPGYKAQHYVKRDAIDTYYPEFANKLDPYHYAGILMMRNTPATRRFIQEWQSLCENYHFIDHSPSTAVEYRFFKGNDCDNGLLNLCLAKHSSLFFTVSPYETNVYDYMGYQLLRPATEEEWDQLRMYPFQIRRLRPPRQVAIVDDHAPDHL
jgi:hypothetical protein